MQGVGVGSHRRKDVRRNPLAIAPDHRGHFFFFFYLPGSTWVEGSSVSVVACNGPLSHFSSLWRKYYTNCKRQCSNIVQTPSGVYSYWITDAPSYIYAIIYAVYDIDHCTIKLFACKTAYDGRQCFTCTVAQGRGHVRLKLKDHFFKVSDAQWGILPLYETSWSWNISLFPFIGRYFYFFSFIEVRH